MASIASIEGIEPALAKALRKAGIRSTAQLLTKAGHAADRHKLAARTGVDEGLLLRWVQRADLMRAKGVGEEFSDLLLHAGVAGIDDLARSTPNELYAACLAVTSRNARIVRRPPSETEVAGWVDHATTLEPAVTS